MIKKYLLCPVCNIPEIVVKVKKGRIIAICNSCGSISELNSVSKFGNYIVKNPPKNETEFANIKKMFEKKRKEQKKTATPTKGVIEEEKYPEASLTLGSQEIIETINRIRKYKDTHKPSANELVDQILTICISKDLKHDLRYYVAIHGLYDSKFLYQWVIHNIILEPRAFIKRGHKDHGKG